MAIFARQRDIIRELAQAGAHFETLENDRYDGTAQIAAAHLGHDGVVKQLIAAAAPLRMAKARGYGTDWVAQRRRCEGGGRRRPDDQVWRSAVTSISIFMRASSRAAEIIMAAGRTSPK